MWVQKSCPEETKLYPKVNRMELKVKFENIIKHNQQLIEKHNLLTTRIAQLTAEGCINATEYWKDEKYLYLLRPMNNGKRIKTYVGNHSLRIEEARQKVVNYKIRLSLVDRQDKIVKEMTKIETSSNELYELYVRSSCSA